MLLQVGWVRDTDPDFDSLNLEGDMDPWVMDNNHNNPVQISKFIYVWTPFKMCLILDSKCYM